jgi:hypothetical protein
MRRNLHWSVKLAVLLGLSGVFVTQVSFWLGVLMILIGLVVPVLALRGGGLTIPAPRRSKAIVEPEHKPAFAVHPKQAHHGVDRRKLGVLRYTLHQANLDSHAPVFRKGEETAVVVSDILVEMIALVEAHGRSVDELARDVVQMYPRIFENAELAFRQYPDEELAKSYIARKTLTDAQWTLDEEGFGEL